MDAPRPRFGERIARSERAALEALAGPGGERAPAPEGANSIPREPTRSKRARRASRASVEGIDCRVSTAWSLTSLWTARSPCLRSSHRRKTATNPAMCAMPQEKSVVLPPGKVGSPGEISGLLVGEARASAAIDSLRTQTTHYTVGNHHFGSFGWSLHRLQRPFDALRMPAAAGAATLPRPSNAPCSRCKTQSVRAERPFHRLHRLLRRTSRPGHPLRAPAAPVFPFERAAIHPR